eukprot:TRINITY_DN6333_c0_g1_i3.p3 TRINITY_DN6333_c0_g1~~TRINITY_DN6333_c0_g1_i3.p3  ORF type:complete len:112 (-),score=11.48 TRINITY_DN6333_c0_g1_i3:357-692(-)
MTAPFCVKSFDPAATTGSASFPSACCPGVSSVSEARDVLVSGSGSLLMLLALESVASKESSDRLGIAVTSRMEWGSEAVKSSMSKDAVDVGEAGARTSTGSGLVTSYASLT